MNIATGAIKSNILPEILNPVTAIYISKPQHIPNIKLVKSELAARVATIALAFWAIS